MNEKMSISLIAALSIAMLAATTNLTTMVYANTAVLKDLD
jgi:hypothetical protein